MASDKAIKGGMRRRKWTKRRIAAVCAAIAFGAACSVLSAQIFAYRFSFEMNRDMGRYNDRMLFPNHSFEREGTLFGISASKNTGLSYAEIRRPRAGEERLKMFMKDYPCASDVDSDSLRVFGPGPYCIPYWAVLPERLNDVTYTNTFGWPLRCMYYLSIDSWDYDAPPKQRLRTEFRGAWGEQRIGRGLPGYMPARILWPGMLVNTVVFATAFLGTVLALSAARRAMRRARGRCTSCGYDIRGLPSRTPCPECGTAQ